MHDQSTDSKADVNSEQLNNLKIENNPSSDFFNFIIDLLKTGVIVFILAIILRYFIIQPYIVDGESMMPNYENNEYLLAEKVSYLFGGPKRGDVVIFRYPKSPSVNYIKRIIGLPGETVTIENNQIKITNKENPQGIILTEKYIPSSFRTSSLDRAVMSKTLNENEFFVLGDNREHSSDSREWGILPKANIVGRSWVSIAKLGNSKNVGLRFYFKMHERVQYSLARPLLALMN